MNTSIDILSCLPARLCKNCSLLFTGSECRPCRNAKRRLKRIEFGDEVRAKNKAYMELNKESIKAKRIVYLIANKEKNEVLAKAVRLKNKDRINAQRRATYGAKNFEIKAARSAAYALNPEHYRLQRKNWRLNNPEKANEIEKRSGIKNAAAIKKSSENWKNQNRERLNLYAKQWAKDHPGARRIAQQNRNAKKNAVDGVLSKGLAEKLLVLQKGKCPCCGQNLGKNYHLDHVVPLFLGGGNVDSNMQLLRGRCNLQKHAKHPIDFMQSRGFLL